tara:strand:- start:2249 stop:2794 length:546 start_codon:yes stop_codon:yes gene_type:complete
MMVDLANSRKSGQIWVSAVLFIALGVIAISLILAAALPLVNKMVDRNTAVQTKQILISIDDTVRTVANEGPGSQRQITPLIIDKGELDIDGEEETISWSMETKSLLMEKDIEIKEGNVHQILTSTFVEEINKMTLWIEYEKVDILLESDFQSPFSGRYTLLVKHTGAFNDDGSPKVEISVK